MIGSRFRRMVVALAAVCMLIVVGWAARDLLRDPLADLGEPEPVLEQAAPVDPAPTVVRDSGGDRSASGYLGSEACATCHAEICESYPSHPMSRSTTPAGAEGADHPSRRTSRFIVPGPAETAVRLEYRVTEENGELMHREAALDAAGTEICGRSVPVHYTVGSGARGHSYFIDAGSQLYMSPMSWYAGAADWDLSPGYDRANEHFERRIMDDCVFCHVGRAAPSGDREHMFDEERPILELGIGCERCHGPGEAHVSYHQAADQSTSTADPIINPANLDQPYRDDVCFQCHLQGLGRVPHPGHRPFDFVPGQAIADVWTLLMHGTKVSGDNTTRAVGQAEQMLASRCYVESAGAMSCTSCHDPHSAPSEEERVEFYRSRCLACHSPGVHVECALEPAARLLESNVDSCIQCHMPALAANDIPHTSQTDHRVLRFPGTETDAAGNDEYEVYEADRIPGELADRSRGMLTVFYAEVHPPLAVEALPLLTPWVVNHPDDADAFAALGTASYFMQDNRRAIESLEKAVQLDPNSEYILRQLMFFNHELGNVEDGIRYGRRLIAINPHHYDYHGRMAHMLGRKGEWVEAIESARKAVEIRPWSPQIHGWLAEAYRITGQEELSEQHAELYEKLSAGAPSDSPP